MKKINLFYRIIAASLVLVTGLFGFVAAGSQTMTLRDYDASIGLLSRPAKTYSGLARLFQPINAEANTFCVNCVNESTFNIERILNKLLRDIVLAFVKSFLNFLQQQFDKLLQMVEQWASTILGIQLNLSSIRKFVAMQTVKLYNQIEGSVNEFFDDVLGPLEDSLGTEGKGQVVKAISDAATTAELAAATAASCENGPGQCSNSAPPPNPDNIIEEIGQAVSEIAAEACRGQAPSSGGDSDIAAAAKVAQEAFIDTTCFSAIPVALTAAEKLEQRVQEIKDQSRTATKDENLKPGNPSSCSPFLKTDASLGEAKTKFGTFTNTDFSNVDFSRAGNLNLGTQSNFQINTTNSVLNEIGNVTFGTKLTSLTEGECDAANKWQLEQEKLREGTKAKNAPQSEDLGAVLQQTLLDFVDSIFKALEQVITKILDAAFQAIATAISNIGIREISGPLSEAFNKARSGINGSISQALRDARTQVRNSITGTSPS